MGTGPLLAMKGITKRFGAVEALVDVDFEVYAREIVVVVGDNGAGKSTLIKAVSGIQPADAGANSFDGRPVSIRTPAAHRLGIATVDQDLTLGDNLDLVAYLFLGGERQSIAIARSLPGDPRLVILDEPTAALGVIQTRSFDRRSISRAEVVAAITSATTAPELEAA